MRTIIILLSFCMTLTIATTMDAFCQESTPNRIKKLAKIKCKELSNKSGFNNVTGPYPMRMSLEEFYKKLEESKDNHILEITVSNCPTKGLCEKKKLADAILQYTEICKNEVEGKIVGDAVLDEKKNSGAFDKFYQAYEIYIKGSASQIFNNYSVTFIKEVETSKNNYEYTYLTWYIINENDAADLRLSAAKRALEETKSLIEYAKAIEEYVKEPVLIDKENQ